MGKISASFFISLDGVVEAPHQWHFPYFDDQMGAAVSKSIAETTAFLMGRVLYEEWSAYWPDATSAPDFAALINGAPKYVASNTLTDPTWSNTTVLSGDVAPQVRALKEGTAGTIAVSGSATLVRWLLANGLLDELNLLVHPIAVGRGQRLFEGTPTWPLKLVKHEVFTTGVLNLSYVPVDA
jgi:dihydrofolate reductase